MKVNSRILAITILILVFGGVGLSNILGLWRTESSKVPAKYTSSDLKNQYNPADIRGSYSLKDISSSFNIPMQDLSKAFNIEKDIDTFKVKDLEVLYKDLKEKNIEIGTASVRYFVALYVNLPFELSEEIYLPKAAVDILESKVKLSEKDKAYINNHTVELSKK